MSMPDQVIHIPIAHEFLTRNGAVPLRYITDEGVIARVLDDTHYIFSTGLGIRTFYAALVKDPVERRRMDLFYLQWHNYLIELEDDDQRISTSRGGVSGYVADNELTQQAPIAYQLRDQDPRLPLKRGLEKIFDLGAYVWSEEDQLWVPNNFPRSMKTEFEKLGIELIVER